jgi:hypothetical protein
LFHNPPTGHGSFRRGSRRREGIVTAAGRRGKQKKVAVELADKT